MADAAIAAPISAPVAPQKAAKATEVSAKPGTEPVKSGDHQFKGTKHRVVIDGAESEIDYEELKAGYQKDKSANKKFEEAQEIKKATSELLNGLQSGDEKAWAWLKSQVPKDVFKKVSFDFAHQQMEYDSLPEDKKRELALNEREQALKDKEEADAQAAQAKQWQADVQDAGKQIQERLDAFTEKLGLAPTSEQLYRMSEYMLANLRAKKELPSMDSLYAYVNKQLDYDAMNVVKRKAVDVPSFLKWLPPEVVKAIKKSFIDESESGLPRRHSVGESQSQSRPRGERKKVGIDEGFALLEKRIKQRR